MICHPRLRVRIHADGVALGVVRDGSRDANLRADPKGMAIARFRLRSVARAPPLAQSVPPIIDLPAPRRSNHPFERLERFHVSGDCSKARMRPACSGTDPEGAEFLLAFVAGVDSIVSVSPKAAGPRDSATRDGAKRHSMTIARDEEAMRYMVSNGAIRVIARCAVPAFVMGAGRRS